MLCQRELDPLAGGGPFLGAAIVAVLRRVSRSFGHRLRLRALHLDTFLGTANSAPARKGQVWLSAGGVTTRRHWFPLKPGGSGAGQQVEPEVTYRTNSLSNTGTAPRATVNLGTFHASVMSTTTSISTAQVVLIVLIWVVIAVVNIAYARHLPSRP